MKLWFRKGVYASKKAQRAVSSLKRDEIRNIAIIRHAALGDMLLTRAFVTEARKAFPNAFITFSIVSHYTYGCPEDLVDRVHVVHGKGERATFLEKIRRIRELGQQDLIFDLADTNKSIKICLLNKATLTIGFPYRMTYARLFYDVATCRSDLNFEVNDMLSQLHVLGCRTEFPHKYDMPGTALKREHSYIVYFPGASGKHKSWPVASFRSLISRMTIEYPDHEHLILEGLQDWEKENVKAIVSPFDNVDNINPVRAKTIEDVIALIKGADLLVSNDTGIRHVAITSGTPSVGVFYRDPYRYWPRYGIHEVAFSEIDDSPDVDQVFNQCVKVLNNIGSKTPS